MRPTDNPLVSIIIPTRDRHQILQECIRHLLLQEYKSFEVIVIDNSAYEETNRMLSAFPQVIQIREKHTIDNPGYLRNLAIVRANGELFAFIDDDSLVQPGWLCRLVQVYADPTVGGASGRVLQDDAPPNDSRDVGIFTPQRGLIYNYNCTATKSFTVDFLAGCNASFRRDALVQVGGYDPAFGFVYEEVDLSFRVRKAGYRLIFQPGMDVYHVLASRSQGNVQRTTFSQDFRTHLANCRSLTYFWLKHFGLDSRYLGRSLVHWPLGDLKNGILSRSKNPFLHALATHLGCWQGIALWVRWYSSSRKAP